MLRIREREGGITTLHRKFFVSIPKDFVGETCVSEKFWYRKILWMRRGAREYHEFQMEIFRLTEPKNFVEEAFCVAEYFWHRKMSRGRERGASRPSLENLLSHRTEQLRRGNLCSRKFLVSKNDKDKRERGASRLSIENFSSHNAEKFRRGTLLCYRKFLVSKNVKEKRKRERGASRLSLENLFSHRTEQLRRGNLCFRKVLVSKNVKDKRERRGGGNRDFLPKFCCLTVQKIFVGETCVSESFWYRKMLRIRERGAITTFHRNFVVSQYRKTSQGKLVFQKISGIEKC